MSVKGRVLVNMLERTTKNVGRALMLPLQYVLYKEKYRNLAMQLLLLSGVGLLGWYLVGNLLHSLEKQHIASGLDFWNQKAGFAVSQSLIPFDRASTYGQAFWVGLLNTLLVALLGIVLATVLGVLVGVARLSKNMLVAGMATFFVETVRNIPLLLQLFFWYFAVLRGLPPPKKSLNFADMVFLNKRGLYIPDVQFGPLFFWGLLLAGGLMLVIWFRRVPFVRGGLLLLKRRLFALMRGNGAVQLRKLTGNLYVWGGFAFVILLAAMVWGMKVDVPALRGFNFRGGVQINPEFMALLIGLTIYTASYIAEIVRGGILAIPKGQGEAAAALGLTQGQTMRYVILPQALRIIIPPLTNQYLNLTKNSSLAVAIGYPDLTSVFAGIVLNQTGQAVEIILMTMGVYLLLSLLISLVMNGLNSHVALVERADRTKRQA